MVAREYTLERGRPLPGSCTSRLRIHALGYLPTLRMPILHFAGTLECFVSHGLLAFAMISCPCPDLVVHAVHIQAEAYVMV